MTNMTDDQLCEAISQKREPKPKYQLAVPNVWDETTANWKLYAGATTWQPLNWLSGENSMTLLEELVKKYVVSIDLDEDKLYHVVLEDWDIGEDIGIDDNILNDEPFTPTEVSHAIDKDLRRAIAKAWMEEAIK